MKSHFVTFYSPGTFVPEQTTKEIDDWDVEKAKQIAQDVKERYNAVPFGFRFTTRSRDSNELDSKVTDTSNMYYLGGTVLTLAQVEAKNDPDDRILISNMKGNGWDRIIVNTNSYKHTTNLNEGDIVL